MQGQVEKFERYVRQKENRLFGQDCQRCRSNSRTNMDLVQVTDVSHPVSNKEEVSFIIYYYYFNILFPFIQFLGLY